jgi:hypothetical protein
MSKVLIGGQPFLKSEKSPCARAIEAPLRLPHFDPLHREKAAHSQREQHHASSNGAVRLWIDQNEGASRAILSVRSRAIGRSNWIATTPMPFISSVSADSCENVQMLVRCSIADKRRHRVAGVLEQIAAIAIQRPLIHPHQRGLHALP